MRKNLNFKKAIFLISILFLTLYFAVLFVVAFPCKILPRNNQICQSLRLGLEHVGLKQNWSQFAPGVPGNNSWIAAQMVCKVPEGEALFSYDFHKTWEPFQKIIRNRYYRHVQNLSSRRYIESGVAQDFAKFILRQECLDSESKKVTILLHESFDYERWYRGPFKRSKRFVEYEITKQ